MKSLAQPRAERRRLPAPHEPRLGARPQLRTVSSPLLDGRRRQVQPIACSPSVTLVTHARRGAGIQPRSLEDHRSWWVEGALPGWEPGISKEGKTEGSCRGTRGWRLGAREIKGYKGKEKANERGGKRQLEEGRKIPWGFTKAGKGQDTALVERRALGETGGRAGAQRVWKDGWRQRCPEPGTQPGSPGASPSGKNHRSNFARPGVRGTQPARGL